MRATGLQSYVERCAMSRLVSILSVSNGLDFCMRLAGATVPAAADEVAVFDQDRSNHRIRRSGAITAAGQAQGLAHVFAFGAHPTDLRTQREDQAI